MRKLLALSIATLLSVAAFAQDLSLRMVSADSLVRAIRIVSGNNVFIAGAAADDNFYSLDSSREEFVEKALDKLREGGYSISEYDGNLYVVKGHGISPSVPPGWFTREAVSEGTLASTDVHEEVTYQNKTYEIGLERNWKKGTKATVQGYVRDMSSGEVLTGISVWDGNTETYATTDVYGFWKLRLPTGRNTLNFSGYPMEDIQLDIIVYEDGGLDVTMKEKVTTLKAAAVSAESVSNHRTARLGLEKIQIDRIKKIPSAFGEGDILKAVLALPGVQSVGEASSGFNVRGGSVDQNLILLNEGTIYNPNHLFGLFSAFNSDVISHAELYKSSIPAEYGGRISSVLDIHTMEGNTKKVRGTLGIGLLTSHFAIDGPIGSEKTTFVLGGRTTYSNYLMKLIPKGSHYHDGKTSFQDLNAGLVHRFNSRTALYLNGYWSRDHFSFSNDTTYNYSNLSASVKLRTLLTAKTTMEVVGGYDSYDSRVRTNESRMINRYTYETAIAQEFAKLRFKYLVNESHNLSFGAGATLFDLRPGKIEPYGESLIAPRSLDRMKALEAAAYISDSWTVSDKLAFEAGARLGTYKSFDGGKLRMAPEFRLSAKYSFLDNLTAKAGFNTMRQNIHMITNTSTISPMDAWTLSGKNIRPQDGFQGAGGLYWTSDKGVDLSVEGYYKVSRGILDYRSGAQLLMNPHLEDDLIRTRGHSYGVEFMVRKSTGKLNGWASYTWSRAFLQQMDRQGVDGLINGGRWYRAPHDKPHNFKLAGNYKFTHRYSLSANIDYSTGRPITVPVAYFYYGGRYYLAYSDRNAYRIPDYFRLDLAMNIEPGHYLRQLMHMSVTFGVYNVTGRKNAYSVYYAIEPGKSKPHGYKVSVFACPIPYLTLNLKF